MITLHNPQIKTKNGKARLIFNLEIDDEKKKVWYEVDEKYSKYLCDDRVDAIFVGVLYYAMQNNHNIETKSYITDELLFKVREYLIPSLSKYAESLHPIKISAKTKPAVKNASGVGTGCSCGIDSLHSYITKSNLEDKKYNITHLCINNVGSFNETYEEAGIDNVRRQVIKKAEAFAKDVNLPIIVSDSNFQTEIPQIHYFTHTYSSTFAIMCLQKLWGIYYYGSSGFDLSKFNIVDNDKHAAGYYDLLSFYCFSNCNMQIYSEGMAKTRLEKNQDIYQSPLLKKHLHICLKEGYNCNVCDKCRRTLLSLYALTDNMEEYNQIFDINYFNSHKEEYFNWLCFNLRWEPAMLQPIYDKLLEKEDFKEFIQSKEEEQNEEPVYDYYKEECEKILNSTTYKVGKVILWLPYKIKKIISIKK